MCVNSSITKSTKKASAVTRKDKLNEIYKSHLSFVQSELITFV